MPLQPTPESPEPPRPSRLPALLVVLALALAGTLTSWYAGRALVRPDVVNQDTTRSADVWFDADLPDSYGVTVTRYTEQHLRAERHPLIAYVMTVPSLALQPLVRDPIARVRVLLAGTAGLTAAVAGALLLAITGGPAGALAFGALWVVSAQFLFWCGAIDTFLFGQLSLLLPLLVLRFRAELGRLYEAALTLTGALALGVTITNWMAGLAVAGLSLPPRRAVQCAANSLLLVLLGVGVLPYLCPKAEGVSMLRHRFTLDLEGNRKFLNRRPIETPYHVLIAAVVAPEVTVQVQDRPEGPPSQMLDFRADEVGRNGPLFFAAAGLWLLLLALGLAGVARGSFDPTFRLSLVALLIGQAALHLVYGKHLFLYAAHYGPMVLLVAAHAARWWPRLALALAVPLVVLCLLRNLGEFHDCVRLLHQIVA